MAVVVVLLCACGGRRLGPGQTRCTTNQFGVTNCQSAGPGGWWCWASESDPAKGFCDRDKRECNRSIKETYAIFHRGDAGKCGVHDSAACVRYEDLARRAIINSCYPTIGGCERELTAMRGQLGVTMLGECTVMN
jgi:hypothetical protein